MEKLVIVVILLILLIFYRWTVSTDVFVYMNDIEIFLVISVENALYI